MALQAHSRRAAVLTELRFHEEAVGALQEALAGGTNLPAATRHEYQGRLRAAQHAARPRVDRFMQQHKLAPDYYSLLALPRSCTTADVRKAYKKMALALHPDKLSFGGYTAQLGSTGSRLADVAEAAQARLQEGASWLFKCLGEQCCGGGREQAPFWGRLSAAVACREGYCRNRHAHSRPSFSCWHDAAEASEVLADPEKRRELDLELQGGAHSAHSMHHSRTNSRYARYAYYPPDSYGGSYAAGGFHSSHYGHGSYWAYS